MLDEGRERAEQVGDSDWLTRCTANGMLLCACPQCRVRLIVTGLLLCASPRSKAAAQYHISPPANSESDRAREIRERERERERAERALLGQLHFPRQSEATRTKVSRWGGSGNDWGSWDAVGDTGIHRMGWGDTRHTHTYTRARGLGQAPRGCWGAPWCSGMHHSVSRVGWSISGGSDFSGGGGL